LLHFWSPTFFKCFDSFGTLSLDLFEVFNGEFDAETYVAGTDRAGEGEDAREEGDEDERWDLRLFGE
jgi:hypothetical protein